MKISEQFLGGKTQFELDFVDIDPDKDTAVFLDPFFLGLKADDFSIKASRTINSFFAYFLSLINDGQMEAARQLFNHFGEPHETCLGVSRGKPRGLGIGNADADRIFESILASKAVQTGLVEHLEDFRVFVSGVDKDKISDMTTNLIRSQLVKYTEDQCLLWKIPLTPNMPTGFYWDAGRRTWAAGFAPGLVIGGKKILLVPKGIVSFAKRYTPEQFHRKYLLEFLQNEHLRMGSVLVQYRADDTAFVTKKSIVEIEPAYSKDYLATFVQGHAKVFANFRKEAGKKQRSLRDVDLTTADLPEVLKHLKNEIHRIQPGNAHASEYHRLVVGILEISFYPQLMCPRVEVEINEGRRRIDLTFDNAATDGQLDRLSKNFGLNCQYIIVECKNYSSDVNNPELDQIQGRFSPNIGRVGLLVSRTVENKHALFARCNDSFIANRGLVLPLFDHDLISILEGMIENKRDVAEHLLRDRIRDITLR